MMQGSILFNHWREVPKEAWRWPNFTPQELASKGNGSLLVDCESLDKLQAARTKAGIPFIINSAYRDPAYNKRIGGAEHSMHMKGKAFDVALNGYSKSFWHKLFLDSGFTGFGLHYATFIHVDTGNPRTW